MQKIKHAAYIFLTLLLSNFAFANNTNSIEIKIFDPWVRATVQNQKSSGGFLSILSNQNLNLIKVSSPSAKKSEIHSMQMNNQIMEMQEIKYIGIPKNKMINLTSDYHLMFFDLKHKLNNGDKIQVNLFFIDSKRKEFKISKEFIVKPINY